LKNFKKFEYRRKKRTENRDQMLRLARKRKREDCLEDGWKYFFATKTEEKNEKERRATQKSSASETRDAGKGGVEEDHTEGDYEDRRPKQKEQGN